MEIIGQRVENKSAKQRLESDSILPERLKNDRSSVKALLFPLNLFAIL